MLRVQADVRVTTLDLSCVPRTEKEGDVDYSKDFFGQSLPFLDSFRQRTFAMAFGDVYTFGPTFRAENLTHAATLQSSG